MIFTYERDLISDAFHRKNIALRVQRDPRTNLSKNLLLGCPFHHVRFGIIKNGSIDFDAGYTSRFGALTPTDLVMLSATSISPGTMRNCSRRSIDVRRGSTTCRFPGL